MGQRRFAVADIRPERPMPKTNSVRKWEKFCLKVRDVGYFLMSHCEFDEATKSIADPRVMAVCVLARTLSNLLAVRHLVRGKHIVEARSIARCCYENSFWIQGILTGGDKFVREMRRDEAASFKSRLEFVFAKVGKLSDPEREKGLRQQLRDDKKLQPKPLNPKETATRGPLEQSYLIYSQLSADAAHPSLSALMRYIIKSVEDGHTVYTLAAVPAPKVGEAAKTLEWACGATVAVCVGVNQIYQGTKANDAIRQIADELVGMAGYD
jgi:hypothetical protein